MKTKLTAMVAIAMVAAACGGGMKREEASEKYIQAICGWSTKCGAYDSEAGCNAQLSALGFTTISTTYNASIASGKIKFDGSAAQKCVDSIASLSCDDFTGSAVSGANENCLRVFQGQVADGDACNPGECGLDSFCTAALTGTCPGTCSPKLGENQAAQTYEQCKQGLVLVSGSNTAQATCQKPLIEGAACTDSSVCANGLYCNGASADAKCEKVVAVGGTCDSQYDACEALAECVGSKCTKPLTKGSACTLGSVACQNDLFCNVVTGTMSGTCTPLLAEGATCSVNRQTCDVNLYCSSASMTCVRGTAVGGNCTQANCDSNGYCDAATHTCVARKTLGEACDASKNQCDVSTTCRNSVCVDNAQICHA